MEVEYGNVITHIHLFLAPKCLIFTFPLFPKKGLLHWIFFPELYSKNNFLLVVNAFKKIGLCKYFNINSKKLIPWITTSPLLSEKISKILYTPKVYYHVKSSPRLIAVVSQITLIRTISSLNYFKLASALTLSKYSFPSAVPTKIFYAVLFSSTRNPTHFMASFLLYDWNNIW